MHAFWWESVHALLLERKRKMTSSIDGYASQTSPIKFCGQTSGGVN